MNLYDNETPNQADWAQRMTASKFKDVCSRKKDFESLAGRLMKKTIKTECDEIWN